MKKAYFIAGQLNKTIITEDYGTIISRSAAARKYIERFAQYLLPLAGAGYFVGFEVSGVPRVEDMVFIANVDDYIHKYDGLYVVNGLAVNFDYKSRTFCNDALSHLFEIHSKEIEEARRYLKIDNIVPNLN